MNKLLLVDDSASIRSIMTRVLREAALDVGEIVEADSLATAVDAVRRDADVGIVLADMGLPGLGGIELVRALRRIRPSGSLAIVAICNVGDAPSAQLSIDAGADAHVERPFTALRIRAVVEPLLGACAATSERRIAS